MPRRKHHQLAPTAPCPECCVAFEDSVMPRGRRREAWRRAVNCTAGVGKTVGRPSSLGADIVHSPVFVRTGSSIATVAASSATARRANQRVVERGSRRGPGPDARAARRHLGRYRMVDRFKYLGLSSAECGAHLQRSERPISRRRSGPALGHQLETSGRRSGNSYDDAGWPGILRARVLRATRPGRGSSDTRIRCSPSHQGGVEKPKSSARAAPRHESRPVAAVSAGPRCGHAGGEDQQLWVSASPSPTDALCWSEVSGEARCRRGRISTNPVALRARATCDRLPPPDSREGARGLHRQVYTTAEIFDE